MVRRYNILICFFGSITDNAFARVKNSIIKLIVFYESCFYNTLFKPRMFGSIWKIDFTKSQLQNDIIVLSVFEFNSE